MQYNTINVIETAVTRNDKNINNSIEKYMSIYNKIQVIETAVTRIDIN